MSELRTELTTEMSGLRTEMKTEIAELGLQIMLRPTRRESIDGIFAIVGLIGAVIAIASRLAH